MKKLVSVLAFAAMAVIRHRVNAVPIKKRCHACARNLVADPLVGQGKSAIAAGHPKGVRVMHSQRVPFGAP
jgi:hypothetical protein